MKRLDEMRRQHLLIDTRTMQINDKPVPMYQYVSSLEYAHRASGDLICALDAVVSIHREGTAPSLREHCAECGEYYPCQTIKTITSFLEPTP